MKLKRLEKDTACESLSNYVDRVHQGTLLITENGKPVAALMSLENVDAETISLSTNPKFLEIIRRSRKQIRAEGGISSDEVRRIFADEQPK